MTQADDALAKKRFFALSIMRLMGAAFVAIVLVGAFDFAVMPLLLARRWRTPRDL